MTKTDKPTTRMNIITRTSLKNSFDKKDVKPYENAKLVVFEAPSCITGGFMMLNTPPIGVHGIWSLEPYKASCRKGEWSYDPPTIHHQAWVTDDPIETIIDSAEVADSFGESIIVSRSPVPELFPLIIEIYDDYQD